MLTDTAPAPRADTWLRALWERRADELRPNDYLQLLLALWLETPAHGGAAQAWLGMAGWLARSDAWGQALRHETDPELLLLALIAARRAGCAIGSWDAHLRALAGEIEQALRSAPGAPPRLWLLLRRLAALLPPDELPRLAVPRPPAELERIYDCPDQSISDLCDYIAAASDCGRQPALVAPAERAILGEALPAIALAYLREFKIDRACDALRSLHYLGEVEIAREQALPFLRLLQQPGGAFGLLVPRTRHRLAQRRADVDLEVYLPTSLSCLWTLALYTHGGDPFAAPGPDWTIARAAGSPLANVEVCYE